MNTPFTSLALLLVLAPAGSPVAYRHDRTDAETRRLAERFPATVDFGPMGSGTLIAPRWVLTAGHVGRGLSPFAPRVRIGEREVAIRQVIPHPESASDGRRPPRVDLALVELEEAVDDVISVALYRGDDEAGREVTIVGYGDHGPAGERLARTDGVRRAVTNTIDEAADGRLLVDFDAPPEGTALEGIGGPGDSGGPLYVEIDDAVFVAGVSSASMGGRPGSYGVVDVYARVSEFAKWMDSAREAARESPPRRPDVRGLEEGFPSEERGELVGAFFEVFELGDEEAFLLFAGDFRSERSRGRSPDAGFARRMTALRRELGALKPARVALLEPGRWAVLVETERADWRAFYFRFELEGGAVRLSDLGDRPDSAVPAENAARTPSGSSRSEVAR